MTPAEKLARALERIADPRNTHFGNDARVVAAEALAAWRSQQAANVMRAPLPKGLAMLPGEIRAAIHAYAEDARQQGMEQANALWEMAASFCGHCGKAITPPPQASDQETKSC